MNINEFQGLALNWLVLMVGVYVVVVLGRAWFRWVCSLFRLDSDGAVVSEDTVGKGSV